MKDKFANRVASVTSSVLYMILGDGVHVAEDHVRKLWHIAI